MKLDVPRHILDLDPYVPGKPLTEVQREYGLSEVVKLASNENPWGPPPRAVAAMAEALADLHRYPDGGCRDLAAAQAAHLGCDPDELVFGNGSNEVIEFLVKAFVRPGDRVITSHPSFLMYEKFVQVHGGENLVVPLREMRHDLDAVADAVDERTRLVFLDNPNNPTGTMVRPAEFDAFLRRLPDHVLVVLDEAYVDFVEEADRLDVVALVRSEGPGVAALRTFSKGFGLAGVRLGYGIVHREVAGVLHRVRQPFNVNTLAQVAALAALEDLGHLRHTVEATRAGMAMLRSELEAMGCRTHPSHTNFFLVDVRTDATALFRRMLAQGVIVRSMAAYGYPTHLRITVGTPEENEKLLAALRHCLEESGEAPA